MLEPPLDAAPDAVLDGLSDPTRLAAAQRLFGDLPGPGAYDRLARLATRLVSAPIGLVCLITDVEVVLGAHGVPGIGASDEAPLGGSPCAVTARAGAPVVTPDAVLDQRLADLPAARAGQLRGFLGVPLVSSDGHVVGVLSVFDPAPHHWTSEDVAVLEQLAASVVAELELAATNAALLTSLGRLDVALEASQVGIWTVDLSGGAIEWDERCAAVFGVDGAVRMPSVDEVLTAHVHPDDHELISEAMATAIESRGKYLVEARAVRPDGTVRWFVARGRVLVDADGDAHRMFGTVIDVTEARAQAQDRLAAIQRAAAVSDVAVELANATRLEQLIQITVRAAGSLGAAMGGLAVFAEDRRLLLYLDQRLSAAVVQERGDEVPPQGIELALDDALPAQYVARTGERVLHEDPGSAVSRFPDMARITEVYGVKASATVPLRVEGRVLGSFTIVWTEPHVFQPDELETLDALSAQIALTLSRLRADSQRDAAVAAMADANQRLQLLADVGRILSGTLDIERQLAQLADLVVPALGDWAWIVSVDDHGRLVEMASAHRDPARSEEVAAYVGLMAAGLTDEGAARIVHSTGQPLVIPELTPERIDAALRDEAARAALRDLEPAAVLAVPLSARGQTLGVLSLTNTARRGPHTRSEIETAIEVGRRAGVALDQMRLFAAQRALADALQRSMLTEPPRPEGCEIVVRYVPAAAGAEIGGDWYDAFLQPDRSTVLAIGDVSGHDTRAAASRGQIRGLLRGISYASVRTPAAVLAELDRAIDGLALDTMATALVAQLTRDASGSARMRWASAGHPAPIVVAPDGTVRVLDAGGADLLLGVDPRQPRHDRSAELAPGSTVLLYTDGLVERRDRGFDAGTAELVSVLGEAAGLPLDQLCDRLLERLFLPDAEDDVAVLALRLAS